MRHRVEALPGGTYRVWDGERHTAPLTHEEMFAVLRGEHMYPMRTAVEWIDHRTKELELERRG